VLDEQGRWVKNGFANDVDFVIERCREQLRGRAPQRVLLEQQETL
jgi:hypothetical protein